MTEKQIEQEIQEKGLNAPRLTPDHIDAQILGEQYFVFPGTTVTICLLELRNGFTVTGESACASPENFDEGIGRKIARENAREKIWQLEGYLLKEKLHNDEAFDISKSDGPVYAQVHTVGGRDDIYILNQILQIQISPELRNLVEDKLEKLIKKVF